MAFRLEISPRAYRDLDSIATSIREGSGLEMAHKWFRDVLEAIESLAHMPERCPVVLDSEVPTERVRLLLQGKKHRSYKIYYSVQHKTTASGTVSIFHVRHWARKTLIAKALQLRMRAN